MGDLGHYFNRDEFRCPCGCGQDTVDAALVYALDALRRRMGAPVTVTSGVRCKEHNSNIGGSTGSQHILGKAADIKVEGKTPSEVADYLEDEYAGKYGIGRYSTWVHLDVKSGPKRRWKK
jgi:uncharacterized protein YcbK (DUF882 family)